MSMNFKVKSVQTNNKVSYFVKLKLENQLLTDGLVRVICSHTIVSALYRFIDIHADGKVVRRYVWNIQLTVILPTIRC